MSKDNGVEATIEILRPLTYLCPVHGEIEDVLYFHIGPEPTRQYCLCCIEQLLRNVLEPIEGANGKKA